MVKRTGKTQVAFMCDPAQIERLRELSERTRVSQANYLREALDDLFVKYADTLKEKGKGGKK